MGWAFWEVEKGVQTPEHSHTNEQVMQVLEGRSEVTLRGITNTYEPGDLVIIPQNIPHSGQALAPYKLMDVFSPTRKKYR